MKRKPELAQRDEYLEYINNCKLKTPEEVAKLFRAVTAVIWDYKLIGKICDFYGDNVIIYREGGLDMKGVQDVFNDTLAYISAYPDLFFEFLDIYCEGDEENGYYFGQVIEFKGTNLGYSKYGSPTGNSLIKDGHGTMDMCECFIKFVNGKWRMHTEWGARSEKANAEVLGAGEVFGTIAQNMEGPLTAASDEDIEKAEDTEKRVLWSDKFAQEVLDIEARIDEIEINDKEDVREFFELFTKLVWNYKMPGRIHDFYQKDIVVQTANWETLNGTDEVIANTLDFMATFPDCTVDIGGIIVYGDNERGYKVFRRMYFDGSNIGVNKYGKSTGKRLGKKKCLCLSMIDFELVGGYWMITKEKVINSDEYIKSVMITDDINQEVIKENVNEDIE